jgi:mono/diheme cytochrome c family protein
MLTKRSALSMLGAVLSCIACEGRRGDDGETPYAARMAVSKPAYVRPATGGGAAHPTPVPAEVFADPQFTAAQAVAGSEVYKTTCARCHASSQWQGGLFAVNWRDRRLSDFHDLVATTMPQDNPGRLTPQQYVDVTAYVLQLAGFPAGDVPLRGDSAMLRHARITIKTPPPTDTTTRK